MTKLKQFLTYAIGLIAGNFCSYWAAEILGDTLGIRSANYMSDMVMIPTNLMGVIELLVIVAVLLATVEVVDRTGLLK
jgi:hypothetical protein